MRGELPLRHQETAKACISFCTGTAADIWHNAASNQTQSYLAVTCTSAGTGAEALGHSSNQASVNEKKQLPHSFLWYIHLLHSLLLEMGLQLLQHPVL